MIALLLCRLIDAYLIVLVVRAVLSFFPLEPGGLMASAFGAVYAITEPVLGPLRRIIPPLGMFDLSFLVLFFGLRVIQGVIC